MTAIDPARHNIEAAKDHAGKTNLAIDYRCVTAGELAAGGAIFDVVLAMEVVEHVRDIGRFLVEAAAMVRPGGMLVAATLNRTLKSFAFAIVGAEYVLRWVRVGLTTEINLSRRANSPRRCAAPGCASRTRRESSMIR